MFPFSAPTRIATRAALLSTLLVSASVTGEPLPGLIKPSPINRAEITVEQPSGVELADGIAKTSFGLVSLGFKSKPKIYTIKNIGRKETLFNLDVRLTGANKQEFRAEALPKKFLKPGESMTFKVVFKPKFSGVRTALLQISSNDVSENPFDIKLAGKGK